ncbi:YaaC family protein [Amycolatopsis sp. NPDC051061]|uniref:YaaC family protein n=1 Tax=Amycolatopsis sp. NPDC051061 TaxID=3155042 RepID=UPI003449AE2C
MSDIAAEFDFSMRSHGIALEMQQSNYLNNRICRPLVSAQATLVLESANADLLWDQLRRVAYVPGCSKRLAGTNWPDPQVVADELSAFISQAEVYYRAGEETSGPSAALQYYYSLLNLAKAELLLWRPDAIINQKLTHGVSAVHATGNFEDWRVKPQRGGVFPLLYEKRMGVPSSHLPGEINPDQLFSRCLESGMEYIQVRGKTLQAVPLYQTIVTDGTYSWSHLLIEGYGVIQQNKPSWDLVREIFEELPPLHHGNPWQVFALSSRLSLDSFALLIPCDGKYVRSGDGIHIGNLRLPEWEEELAARLRPMLGHPHGYFDGTLTVSLSDSEFVGLTSDLARYLSVYLVSSLIRYRPSALDLRLNPDQAWYLAAFTRQAALPALQSAANEILDNEFVFLDRVRG